MGPREFDELPALVAALVAKNPTVIFAATLPAAQADSRAKIPFLILDCVLVGPS
jgi:hypothetical protein